MFNYHSHTVFCFHAQNTPEEMILEAIDKNFSEIGISDHYGKLPDGTWMGHSLKEPDIYFSELKTLKEKYKNQITVKIGAEMDFDPLNADRIYNEIVSYDPDYILGSIHLHKGFFFSAGPKQYRETSPEDMDRIIRSYLETLVIMAERGYVNCVDHFDHFKKFWVLEDDSIYYPYYERIAEALRDNNMALELNTHYFEGEADYIRDPNLFMLKKAAEYDIPVIVSSDCHCREDLSHNFPLAFECLKEAGIKTTCRFENRKVIKEEFVY